MTTDNRWEVRHGDCRDIMRTLPDNSVDAIVSDPPYGLAFMGKEWDHGVPGVEFWTEALRVAKPGAHLVAFGGTRTFHRLAVAIEDAGWEVRDCLSWLYGSGFPKSLDVGKAIDKQRNDLDDVVQVTLHIAQRAGELGVSRRMLNQAIIGADNDAGSAQSWTTITTDGAHKPRVPTWDQWLKLKPLLQLSDEMDAEVWRLNGRKGQPGEAFAEREVVGKDGRSANESWLGTAKRGENGFGIGEWHITRPATDAAKQWDGWGTALKPAWEPIVLARKPLVGTVAANVTQYGTGGINVDGCRIGDTVETWPKTRARPTNPRDLHHDYTGSETRTVQTGDVPSGRWPANVCLDEDAAALFPESRFFFVAREGQCDNVNDATPTSSPADNQADSAQGLASQSHNQEKCGVGLASTPDCDCSTQRHSHALNAEPMDSIATTQTTPTCCESCGSALPVTEESTSQASAERVEGVNVRVSETRFLYSPKASRREREAGDVKNVHPTVKPIALMRWLCRLVTPPNGLVLDPFNGSGSTGCAAVLEGFRYLGAELDAEYVEIARKRIAHWASQTPEPDLFG
jgi:DNA modification methylase